MIETVIVSWDFTNGKDVGVLFVGTQKDEKFIIINVFQGKEAEDLYSKLTKYRKFKKGLKNNND